MTGRTDPMQLGESLLLGLKQYGAAEIFGIPGDFALPLFRVIEETGILPLYTLSHEPAVGFAADGAARAHGKPSVAAVTYGAGALNVINAIAAAYAEKSPVILLSGGPGDSDRSTGLLVHHQAKQLNSQMQMYREVTCDQIVLNDPETAPDLIARALRNCIAESRPVYIEVPRDRVFSECAPVPYIPTVPTADPDALAACVQEIRWRLKNAKSPVLMVGVEIRRFGLEAQVTQLCRNFGIPVVTTFMGRGVLARQKVPLKGTYLGVAGNRAVTELVENSDALMLLGVLLSDTNFGVSEKKIDVRNTILACDGQVTLGYHQYKDIPLSALVASLNEKVIPCPKVPAGNDRLYPTGIIADHKPITPADIATAVNDILSDYPTMPIAADMGDCLFTALDIQYTELVAPGYYATMGFGVPAGLGVQAATGRRPLILVGDGAFQMTGWELLNCTRYGWNPIVLVFNNRSWEMLRAFQPESTFNDLEDINYAEVSQNLGGKGYRVSTRRELQLALKKAITDESTFQLIDIVMERGVLSDTLSRFVSGIKNMRAGNQSAGFSC